MSDGISTFLLKKKYLAPGEETAEQMWERVAERIATGSRLATANDYYGLLKGWAFVPGGRILAGTRLDSRYGCMNCFFIDIEEDSIEGIMATATRLAKILKAGGGCGIDLTKLRPKKVGLRDGRRIAGAASFMELFADLSNAVSQDERRGAVMVLMSAYHPDIVDFINKKADLNKALATTVTVKLPNAFIQAVHQDQPWSLRWPAEPDGDEVDTISARELYSLLTRRAWESGEPGVFFIDQARDGNLGALGISSQIGGLNPCGEQPLAPDECCNLGAVNLATLVREPFLSFAMIDEPELERRVRLGVRFLTDVIFYNRGRYPDHKTEAAALASRRIGLGVMGFADMLVQLGMRYDSESARLRASSLFEQMLDVAYDESAAIAEILGPYPLYQPRVMESQYLQKVSAGTRQRIATHGMANLACLTVAPTGSTSLIANVFGEGGVSWGTEPIFTLSQRRSVVMNGSEKREFVFEHPCAEEYRRRWGDLSRNFVEAHGISWKYRLAMQASIQCWVDAGIASTVNLPADFPLEGMEELFLKAGCIGLKGLTVFRDGSRGSVVQGTSRSSLVIPERPAEVKGDVLKTKTACGTLYVTLGRDSSGRLIEVFAQPTTRGGCPAQTQALSKIISISLRAGVSPWDIMARLRGIHCRACAVANMEVLSCADAIARLMAADIDTDVEPILNAESCPRCGKLALMNPAGCGVCLCCGWSRCG